MKDDFKKSLLSSIKQCGINEYIEVYPYKKEILQDKRNHFLVMMKPEVVDFNNNVHVDAIIDEIENAFERFNVNITACYVAGGKFIRNHSLMEKQYSMLNRGSHTGLKSFTPEFAKYVEQNYEGRKILGAYEFVNEFPEYTVEKLEKISHEIGSKKVGNGLYLLELNYRGNRYGIINAFHPHQLEHFNNDQSKMVFLECAADAEYEILAQEVIGFFDPSRAMEGSLRNIIYKKREQLNISEVGIFYNGFHISPSPLEGMFATLRYSSIFGGNIDIEDIPIGKKLLDYGFSKRQIVEFQRNPYLIKDNQWKSLFDIAEGENEEYIIEFIKQNHEQLCY